MSPFWLLLLFLAGLFGLACQPFRDEPQPQEGARWLEWILKPSTKRQLFINLAALCLTLFVLVTLGNGCLAVLYPFAVPLSSLPYEVLWGGAVMGAVAVAGLTYNKISPQLNRTVRALALGWIALFFLPFALTGGWLVLNRLRFDASGATTVRAEIVRSHSWPGSRPCQLWLASSPSSPWKSISIGGPCPAWAKAGAVIEVHSSAGLLGERFVDGVRPAN
jgi:hypothetical protein